MRASLRLREAENFLRDNRARSISSCYANPNARCPVCKEPVFFYANAAGSRVYFDELGPPWQKHPCTDNPRQRINEHPSFSGPPTRRARGITQEIIEAARIAGSFRSPAASSGRLLRGQPIRLGRLIGPCSPRCLRGHRPPVLPSPREPMK